LVIRGIAASKYQILPRYQIKIITLRELSRRNIRIGATIRSYDSLGGRVVETQALLSSFLHYRRPKSHAVRFNDRQSPGQRIEITRFSHEPFKYSDDFCGNRVVRQAQNDGASWMTRPGSGGCATQWSRAASRPSFIAHAARVPALFLYDCARNSH
jgi:hypothetical protein